MIGGNNALRLPLSRALIPAGALNGEIYVVVDEKGKIVSYALCFAPGQSLFQTTGKVSARSKRKYLGETNIWYLNVLATDPAYQRRDFASSLVNDVFDKMHSDTHWSGL
ncbi:hypothetical protein M422DRAFT_275223 [Sphaerobolus stellatus SS14]|uniref:N-acetyltransferase domain-containing protein n=1 Tax=Sphaerobolus stellatus (strain SS14) TaxID=990650 RepID=A0A0C9U4M7_SPHS4|nr:hypothetical protein M422DRAFT_275223 [Sphaerobolus stellatus SS14]